MALIAHRRLFLIAPKNQLPLTGSISPSLFLGPPGKAIYIIYIYIIPPTILYYSYPADEFTLALVLRGKIREGV